MSGARAAQSVIPFLQLWFPFNIRKLSEDLPFPLDEWGASFYIAVPSGQGSLLSRLIQSREHAIL